MLLTLSSLLPRLLLALSLVLGPWPAVLAAAPSAVEAAEAATVAEPPCHRPAAESAQDTAAPDLPAPCCDCPCVGCATALCGLGQASALPASDLIAPRLAALSEFRARHALQTPPPYSRERLRPPIA